MILIVCLQSLDQLLVLFFYRFAFLIEPSTVPSQKLLSLKQKSTRIRSLLLELCLNILL